MKTTRVITVVAAASLALCAGAATGSPTGPRAGSTVSSGLYGVVRRGPVQPVCRVDDPCDEPAAGARLRFLRAGRLVLQVVTGPKGGYRARLRAGTYAVRTDQKPFGAIPSPATVRVFAGRFRRVNFSIDTGIR